jgi:N-acetylneuraminic acid mutarotase
MSRTVMVVMSLMMGALVPAANVQPPGGQWITRAPMNEARQEVAVAALDGKIYVIGGIRMNGSTADTVEAYDPATDTWQFVAPLPLPLHHTTAAVVEDKLYVIGGLSGLQFRPTNAVFEYTPGENVWRSRRPLPTSRGALAVAVIDGKIYAAGGSPPPRERDFAVYDPAADRWEALPNIPTPRNHLAAGAIGKKFYAVGGRTGGNSTLNVVEIFDTETNTWTAGPSLPTGRSGIAAVVVSDVLYVFGGEGNFENPNGVFEENEAFFPQEEVWRSRAPMPTPRHGIGAAAIGHIIYIPGGAPIQGFSVTGVNEAFVVEP